MKKRRTRIISGIVIALLLAFALSFCIYTQIYYHADDTAIAALNSDADVTVSETDYGWAFDGPSDDTALIFYPGAKVEETAYAPLLHRLAQDGMDVFLLKMPARLAFFDTNKADEVLLQYSYDNWYIGGHSLGGAMASMYLVKHRGPYKGLILLAAYQTKPLSSDLRVLAVYGSNDKVLDVQKVKDGETLSPAKQTDVVIDGGNHAEFGNYGEQKGDGKAGITAEEQQQKTCDAIVSFINAD